MNDPEKLTMEKFQVLKLVDEISKKNDFGAAPVQELIDIITSRRGVKSGAVRKIVWELNRDGYLENPLRGCWRLTFKGVKLLREIETTKVRGGEPTLADKKAKKVKSHE